MTTLVLTIVAERPNSAEPLREAAWRRAETNQTPANTRLTISEIKSKTRQRIDLLRFIPCHTPLKNATSKKLRQTTKSFSDGCCSAQRSSADRPHTLILIAMSKVQEIEAAIPLSLIN